MGKCAHSFCALSRHVTKPPAPIHVHEPGSYSNPVLLIIMEASLHRHDLLNQWPLVIDSTSTTATVIIQEKQYSGKT